MIGSVVSFWNIQLCWHGLLKNDYQTRLVCMWDLIGCWHLTITAFCFGPCLIFGAPFLITTLPRVVGVLPAVYLMSLQLHGIVTFSVKIDQSTLYAVQCLKQKNKSLGVFCCRGGYRVIPTVFEFWQGQTNRLHDRLRFRKPSSGETIGKDLVLEVDDGWLLERLSP